MIRITANPNNTIEEIVKRLVKEASEDRSCSRIIADFTDENYLNSDFAGIKYSAGDIYSIKFALETGDTTEFLVHINYKIEKGNVNKKRLVGIYTPPNSNDGKDISKEKLAVIIKYPVPEQTRVRLEEIEFIPLGKEQESLYPERHHENAKGRSKFKTALHNIGGDLSFMAYSLYSDEPPSARFRRSTATPWLVFGGTAIALGIASLVYLYLPK